MTNYEGSKRKRKEEKTWGMGQMWPLQKFRLRLRQLIYPNLSTFREFSTCGSPLNSCTVSRRKALNGAKRLNGWNYRNWLSDFVKAAFSRQKNPALSL